MGKTLIIPDIHLKHSVAEEIIKSVNPDNIIFLGDYFDAFDDCPSMVQETADWLVWSVNQINRIHIRGNHDISYEYPYNILKCSGYAQWKEMIIGDIIPKSTWNKLKWYHILDSTWLLTHAGLDVRNVPKEILDQKDDRLKFLKLISDYLDDNIIIGLRNAANNQPSWILNAGRGRGGQYPTGGIVWCDFKEFQAIRGLNSIFGHTPSESPEWINLLSGDKQQYMKNWTPIPDFIKNSNLSFNLNLDTHLKHYVIWDGYTISVHSYTLNNI